MDDIEQRVMSDIRGKFMSQEMDTVPRSRLTDLEYAVEATRALVGAVEGGIFHNIEQGHWRDADCLHEIAAALRGIRLGIPPTGE